MPTQQNYLNRIIDRARYTSQNCYQEWTWHDTITKRALALANELYLVYKEHGDTKGMKLAQYTINKLRKTTK